MGKPSSGQKKLSWTYRRKVKLGRIQKSEISGNNGVNTSVDDKSARIIVRNLPFKVTDKDVRKFYEPFGEIKEINLLKHPNGKLVGCGFIQFKHVEDASKAIFNTNKKDFLGRIINSDWAISKSKFCKKLEARLGENGQSDEGHTFEDKKEEGDAVEDSAGHKEKNNAKQQKSRKLQRMKKQKKRARIVIRNLSFQATHDDLKEYFSQYGNIEEIKILTRNDGKRIGCAFVQFDLVQSAAKAIHYANMQQFSGRAIVVDWAVAKKKFLKNSTETNVNPQVKSESTDKSDSDDGNAESDSKQAATRENGIKTEDEFDDEEVKLAEDTDSEDESADDSDDDDNSGDNDDEDGDDGIKDFIKEEERSDEGEVKQRISDDVNEGRTVFLKNVPFSIKNNELKGYMEQFGPVYYALVCIDRLTEHSKGTAFVKFKNITSAERCLSTELRMHDQIIEAHRALCRNEVENKKSLKQRRIKDSRNLYLVKEGAVLAGSSAAAEVSVSDMAKRLKLEQWKSQMLRNLNMFVSRVRLVVHNLPLNLDDAKFRQLFKNHSGPKAVIKEARVMRDLKNVDATGRGKSKEYGFVTFTVHEDALKALRSLNNNPNIFSKSRRPIIGFSIENRIMVNAKERRIQKSREHNPLCSKHKEKRKAEDVKVEELPNKRVKMRKLNDSDEKSCKKVVRKKVIKKEKTKKKQENNNAPTKKLEADDVTFNKLVDSYKSKLKGMDLRKSKWYEETSSHS
ncbi:PREDICTED: RNA-binding protein 28 isoform X2 [Dinoponera quadriceps]|uniref:RNA-binding protein 28 isoform X2 n=1 Tax=Dinoponera quadriceps TaxID=609295 RepID=A0A6P3XGC1_DINQU|nr:PREDICTED: RNA-binding protein 28 isoform X2 [Dinoponera quadriceps]